MKTQKILWIVSKAVLGTLIVSCSAHEPEKYISPSGLYQLQVEVSENHEDSAEDGCLRLVLHDTTGRQMSFIKTQASDYSKWSLAWHPRREVVVLNSHDIGTLAWQVTPTGILQKISVTPDLDSVAIASFNRKYKQ